MGLLQDLANLRGIPIVQSDTTVYDPPLLALDIFTAGDVAIVTPDGTAITKTFPAAADGGGYPYRWWIRIRQVLDTGTTVADDDLLGIK